jgi:alkylhydroperoxidase family enzyme
MVWIKTIPEDEAAGLVKEVYDHSQARVRVKDRVPEVVKVFSLKPKVLEAVENLRTALKDGASGLGRDREEMIAVVISALTRCTY